MSQIIAELETDWNETCYLSSLKTSSIWTTFWFLNCTFFEKLVVFVYKQTFISNAK